MLRLKAYPRGRPMPVLHQYWLVPFWRFWSKHVDALEQHLEKIEHVPSVKGKKDMSGRERATGKPAPRLIDQRIRDLGVWRGETLARMRALILEADPKMNEEWKWMGTPVWSHRGIVCTGEAYTKS